MGETLDNKIRTDNQWTLLPNLGLASSIAPAVISSNILQYTKFPEFFGKVTKIRKTIRQCKEFKSIFADQNINTIKEEICPIILSKIGTNLTENGKEGVAQCVSFISNLKFNSVLYKDNLFDLQPSVSISKKFEKINPTIKSLLTKKLNEKFKALQTPKKLKSKVYYL